MTSADLQVIARTVKATRENVAEDVARWVAWDQRGTRGGPNPSRAVAADVEFAERLQLRLRQAGYEIVRLEEAPHA